MTDKYLGMDGVWYSSFEAADSANEEFIDRHKNDKPLLGLDGNLYYTLGSCNQANDEFMERHRAQGTIDAIFSGWL